MRSVDFVDAVDKKVSHVPGERVWNGVEFLHAIENEVAHNLKHLELFISRLFHLVFPDFG